MSFGPGRIKPRKICINGHPTSTRLEPEFWDFLKEIAAECGRTVKALIEGIVATKNPKYPLTVALRLYIAAYWRDAHGRRYYVDLDRGTRRPRSKRIFSDGARTPRPRAA
jgi:predicted DNA-binding ribbon-helix-helix protein